jgi:hypothetical protein
MLSRLGGRGYQVREDQTIYGDERNDFDPDFDSDLDEDGMECANIGWSIQQIQTLMIHRLDGAG